jgi:hypothetical protein
MNYLFEINTISDEREKILNWQVKKIGVLPKPGESVEEQKAHAIPARVIYAIEETLNKQNSFINHMYKLDTLLEQVSNLVPDIDVVDKYYIGLTQNS